ncbi:MAG: hypothetical protein P0Y56_01280 [Candidatus Andeanibacterium colombiense]|uniref:Uncharacterized protein n=1 Tax=Candidatus Andeanibacterium colombiense TaxID=3121345 RepID=A0AAJ5X6W8_9SPHN|nr:MAG: hypothetical protein P0Y56_01280 [Sphingomonadaceae bacterium]
MIKNFKDIKGFNRIFEQSKDPSRDGGTGDQREEWTGGGMASLLEAVCEQAVSLQCEQERASARTKQELELLTGRMAMLAPLCGKTIEALALDDAKIEELTREGIERKRQLEAAEAEVAQYRPLAFRLEEELRADRAVLEESRRANLRLGEELEKIGAENQSLAHRAATFEGRWQRSAEENEAHREEIGVKERAIEKLTREVMLLQSDSASQLGDLERRNADVATLNGELNSSLKENLGLSDELKQLKAALTKAQHEQRSQIRDLNSKLTATREQLASREEQAIELENANIALRSQVEFLTRAGERQREDVSRHLHHIGQLEASNRHLFDTLSRGATADEFESLDAAVSGRNRAGKGKAALRAVGASENAASA